MTATTTRTGPHAATTPRPNNAINARLRRVLALHFDPRAGTAWWLDRAKGLGLDPLRDVQSTDDLHRFGCMTAADLCERPLLDYIPRALHGEISRFIVGQTGGTTGGPANSPWTAYRQDEFEEAFIQPFHIAAEYVGFPRGGSWLYAGPSGTAHHRDSCASAGGGHGRGRSVQRRFRSAMGQETAQRFVRHVVAISTTSSSRCWRSSTGTPSP